MAQSAVQKYDAIVLVRGIYSRVKDTSEFWARTKRAHALCIVYD